MRGLPHVLIVGGGIGGMTASIALRNEGFTTEVFEKQPNFRAVGVGVILCPNTIKSFGALGRDVRESVLSGGAWFSEDFLHCGHRHQADDGTTERFTSGNGPIIEEEFGAPSGAIRRSELLEILVRAHGAEGLHAGKECSGFDDASDRVVARFADGTMAEGDILVGADGLGSAVRIQLHGDARPEYSGFGSLRGLTRGFTFPSKFREGLAKNGDGANVIAVPAVQTGEITYWSSSFRTEEGTWPYDDPQLARSMLLERIAAWRLLPDVVRDADAKTLVAREHRDRPPLESWGIGRVTLLGDAAHPMTNMWGQGVATATEDGVILSRCLAAGISDPAAALRRYERMRIPRTSKVVIASHTYGDWGEDRERFTRWLYTYDAAVEPLTTEIDE